MLLVSVSDGWSPRKNEDVFASKVDSGTQASNLTCNQCWVEILIKHYTKVKLTADINCRVAVSGSHS